VVGVKRARYHKGSADPCTAKEIATVTDRLTPNLTTLGPADSPVTRHTTDLQRNVQNRIKREKARLLQDWVAAGGSEADFEEAWPSIHAQLGQIRVQEIGDKARTRSLTAFKRR
jgi:hypothetical protein